MALASKFTQPMDYAGQYRTSSWAGYVFKEALGYTSGRHTGVDYNGAGGGNADIGLAARSVANGIVRYVGNHTNIGFGNTVIIEHPLTAKLKSELGCDSLFSRYMHLKEWHVSVGQEVNVGTGIGLVGNTGTQYAHLHVDLYKNTITGGGVHLRYDKDTQLTSYLDVFEFIAAHTTGEATTQPYQRVVGAAGVNYRKEPNTSATIIKEFVSGEIMDFKGYVTGQAVNGNNIWFVGKYTGGYSHSGSFTDSSTNGLDNLTLTPAPEPTPPVAAITPDSALVKATYPSPNFLDKEQTPQFIVIHQWDDPAKHPSLQGVINHFLDPSVEVAAHYVIDDSGIYQLVKENKRAYHAGVNGNDGIGIELDPNGSEAMYAHARGLIADIRARRGSLDIKKHSDFMATACPKFIDLTRLEAIPDTTPPTPTPETPTPPPVSLEPSLIKQLVEALIELIRRVTNLFKK